MRTARFSDRYTRAVGQVASPAKCVNLITSKAAGKRLKWWAILAGDRGWSVKLDVRVLGRGGHLDVTHRECAGTLANRFTLADSQVHLVSVLPLGFLRLLALTRSKYLLAGLNSSQGAAASRNSPGPGSCPWPIHVLCAAYRTHLMAVTLPFNVICGL